MMNRILLTLRGFFRKERIDTLPRDSGVGIVFGGYRKEGGYCNITKFIKAFGCKNVYENILSYSLESEQGDVIDGGEIFYYAYAVLDERNASIVANVLNAKMIAVIGDEQMPDNAKCDTELKLDGAVPLIWSDRSEIKFKISDYERGMK